MTPVESPPPPPGEPRGFWKSWGRDIIITLFASTPVWFDGDLEEKFSKWVARLIGFAMAVVLFFFLHLMLKLVQAWFLASSKTRQNSPNNPKADNYLATGNALILLRHFGLILKYASWSSLCRFSTLWLIARTLVLTMVVAGVSCFAILKCTDFFTYRVQFSLEQDRNQDSELEIVRVWNPLHLQITTGIFSRGQQTETFHSINKAWTASTLFLRPLESAEVAFKTSNQEIDIERILEAATPNSANYRSPNLAGYFMVETNLIKKLDSYLDMTYDNKIAKANAYSLMVELGKATDVRYFEQLDFFLKEKNEAIPLIAINAIGNSGRRDYATGLVPLLTNDNNEVCLQSDLALVKLVAMQEPEVNSLMVLLDAGDSESEFHVHVLESLADLGGKNTPLVERLEALTKNKNIVPEMRLRAAEDTLRLCNSNSAATEQLVNFLTNSDSFFRRRAVIALAQSSSHYGLVTNALNPLQNDRDPLVRQKASETLRVLRIVYSLESGMLLSWPKDINQADSSSTKDMGETPQAYLMDPNPHVRTSAARILGSSNETNDLIFSKLQILLHNNPESVTLSAIDAIGHLGQKRSDWTDERLLALLQDNQSEQRQIGSIVLAYRAELDPKTKGRILNLRQNKYPWVRVASWDTLLLCNEREQARTQNSAYIAVNGSE